MLAISVAIIETTESRRQEDNLDEQYKQQVLRDYFNELNTLVFDPDKFDALRNSKSYDPKRELLGSRTLATLEILGEDKKRKIQIIRFVGNSSLSRFIPIRRADLSGLDLSYVDLTGADLRATKLNGTNLTGAKLREAYLCGSDLSGVNFEDAILTNARYSDNTIISEGTMSDIQLDSMDKKTVKLCGY